MQPFVASQSRECRSCLTKWFTQFMQDSFAFYQLIKSGQLTYKTCITSNPTRRFLLSLFSLLFISIYILPKCLNYFSVNSSNQALLITDQKLSLNSKINAKLHKFSNSGSASSLKDYFVPDVTEEQLNFFQEHSESDQDANGENFIYYSNFIQHHTLENSAPLLGNGKILAVYDHEETSEDTKARIRSLLTSKIDAGKSPGKTKSGNYRNHDSDDENSDIITQEDINKNIPFACDGNFRVYKLLNTSNTLSSIVSLEIPINIGIFYTPVDEQISEFNNLAKLNLKTGEIGFIREFSNGITVSQTSFAHRTSAELFTQTIEFSGSQQRKISESDKFSASDPVQKFISETPPWVSSLQSAAVQNQYTENQDNYRLFSGIVQRDMPDGRVLKLGVVVIQEKNNLPNVEFKLQDTIQTVTVRTLIYTTKVDLNIDMVQLSDELSNLREIGKKEAVQGYNFGKNLLTDRMRNQHRNAWNNLYHTNIELRYHKSALIQASEEFNGKKSGIIYDMMHKFHSGNEHHDVSYFYSAFGFDWRGGGQINPKIPI